MLDVRPSHADADGANSEVETWLAEALAQIATEPVDITPATRLIEDLGLDSLALAEIGELIGERASRDIAPEELADLRTVADLQMLATQPSGNGRSRMPSYAKFAEPYTVHLPSPLKWLGRFAVRGAERAIFDGWLKPKILGRGNVPANRNFIVVANHSSHLDFSLVGHALGAIGDDLRVLAANDYFFNTPARRFLAANFTSMMPFDRERAQLESLEDALAELAQGRSVLMFPEGTRSADGEIHEFKSGAGFLALRSRCDVLPMLIRGTHDVMGKGSLVPRRHPVEVRIGRAITATELRESCGKFGRRRRLSQDCRPDAQRSCRALQVPAHDCAAPQTLRTHPRMTPNQSSAAARGPIERRNCREVMPRRDTLRSSADSRSLFLQSCSYRAGGRVGFGDPSRNRLPGNSGAAVLTVKGLVSSERLKAPIFLRSARRCPREVRRRVRENPPLHRSRVLRLRSL